LFQENDICEFNTGKDQEQQKWQTDGRFNGSGPGPAFRVAAHGGGDLRKFPIHSYLAAVSKQASFR
jgi:hypothetical protein